jgi:aerobic carbon-monoxide dehydrogenase small subunit
VIAVRLTINGTAEEATVAPHESLLTALRERFGLPGSKNACEQGECGSCSVLMDGVLVCSCLVLAAAADGRSVRTVESLASDAAAPGREAALHPVQRAFADAGAVQCGFCTPGLIVATYALLRDNHEPTLSEIREALSGNLCRCTGYGKILEAVQTAARAMYARGSGEQ